jgi:ABC-type cobalamin/Fe3+-siderophores transport system ATPase subunit
MALITINSISFHYDPGTPVLSDVSLEVNRGETWAIIGKNGSGKSTLLKCIGNMVHAACGSIMINDRPIHSYRPMDLAKLIAYVPQASGRLLPPYTVSDFIMLGRFPYQGFFALPSSEDRRIVREVRLLTDTDALAERAMNTLSGGELQRVFLAAAVAQKTDILLLDEPMSFLDPLHQEMIHRSLGRIHDEFNTTIITVTHDVNLALNRFSHICALTQGKQFFIGPCEKFKENANELLHEIYSINFLEIKNYNDSSRYYLPEGMR